MDGRSDNRNQGLFTKMLQLIAAKPAILASLGQLRVNESEVRAIPADPDRLGRRLSA